MAESTLTRSATFQAIHETRLAIVIYGGVSLAIYINGVAQELLRLIRATAPASSDASTSLLVKDASGSESVYRKLGQLIRSPNRPETWEQIKAGKPVPVYTRFVIDVLSGTSAGGINAIFLAKALANNQSMDSLENLWISEGDIEKLINDSASATDGLSKQEPPQSLLNSGRMYLKLLNALDGMDDSGPNTSTKGLVDTLDLFSTATDIRGLQLPIALSERNVFERRHRNVFHFRVATKGAKSRNDLKADINPFLAFAARCTSAFPFAFEPMALGDIFPVLRNSAVHSTKPYCDPESHYWERFYADYVSGRVGVPFTQPFSERPFGDGGYLDNKPFSYAVDTILTRSSDLPVSRKLIYVEPSPEHFVDPAWIRPNAIENSLAALLTLPRYENIRQDLERVVARNVEIERINRVIEDIKAALRGPLSGAQPEEWLNSGGVQYGAGYATYERLKLSSVTVELADILAVEFGFHVHSALGTAIRTIADVWRTRKYPDAPAQRQFLMDFDVSYRLRRIRYVWRKISEQFAEARSPRHEDYCAELQRIRNRMSAQYVSLQDLLEPPIIDLDGRSPFAEEDLKFITDPGADLPTVDGGLYPQLAEHSDAGRRERARYLLQGKEGQDVVDELASRVREKFKPALILSGNALRDAIIDDPSLNSGARQARQDIRTEFQSFERYDSAAFPITFGTSVGECEQVEIHRISPMDATSRNADVLKGKQKLRGEAVGAFGAFLDREWRRNDILWGRLDAAERIIGMLLPEQDVTSTEIRRELVEEAHRGITTQFLRLEASAASNWKRHLEAFVENVPAEPKAELVVKVAARGSAVVGQLLEGIAETRAWPGQAAFARIATAGRLLFHLVEISVPRSWRAIVGTYWLRLLLLFSVLSLIVAFVFGQEWRFAGTFFGVVVLLFVARELLRRYLHGEGVVGPVVVSLGAGASIVCLSVAMKWILEYAGDSQIADVVEQKDALLMSLLEIAERASYAWQSRSLRAWISGFALAAATVTLVTFLIVNWLSGRADRVRKQRGVVRRLRSARSLSDIVAAIGHGDFAARVAATRVIRADYALLTAYGLTFASVGLLLVHGGSPWGFAVIVLGLGASVINAVESNVILGLLKQPFLNRPKALLPSRPEMLAVCKWVLLAAAVTSSVVVWLAGAP